MVNDKSLWTQTLADVYAGQGYWGPAAEIYRYLLERSPGNREYLEALGEVENRSAASKDRPSSDAPLVALMSTWIDLEMGYARVGRLKALLSAASSQPEGVSASNTPNPLKVRF